MTYTWNLDFGKRLAHHRRSADMKQTDTARAIGKSKQAVWMWEHGRRKPSLDTLEQMGSLYGVSVDELLSDISITKTTWKPLVKLMMTITQDGKMEAGYFCDEKTDDLLKLISRVSGADRERIISDAIRMYASSMDWQKLITSYYAATRTQEDTK